MQTLQEIKDQVALEHGCDDWQYLENYFADGHFPYSIVDQVAKAYAKAMIQQDRIDCAEKAITKHVIILPGYEQIQVDKSSILDRPLPDLK